MTVVPTAGMDWSPPLGSGATDLCGLAFLDDVAPALLVAVAAAVADDAGAVPDAALLARARSTRIPPPSSNPANPRTRLVAAPAIRSR